MKFKTDIRSYVSTSISIVFELAHVIVCECVQTDRAFGAGHCSRQVELGPRPPDPLSDGLWTAIINDCRETEHNLKSSISVRLTFQLITQKVTNDVFFPTFSSRGENENEGEGIKDQLQIKGSNYRRETGDNDAQRRKTEMMKTCFVILGLDTSLINMTILKETIRRK